MNRTHRITTALACMAALGLAQVSSAQAVSGFDADLEGWKAVGFDFNVVIGLPPTLTIAKTDNSADLVWDAGNTIPGFDGNPGGFARFVDQITDPASFLEAPASFTTGLSGLAGETIKYDHRIFNDGTNPTSVGPYVTVLLSGNPSDLNAYVSIQPGPSLPAADTGWVTISTIIDAANFVPITDVDLGLFDPGLAGQKASTYGLNTPKTFAQVLADDPTLLISFEMVDNNSAQQTESDGVDNVVITPEPTSLALLGLGGLLLGRRRR